MEHGTRVTVSCDMFWGLTCQIKLIRDFFYYKKHFPPPKTSVASVIKHIHKTCYQAVSYKQLRRPLKTFSFGGEF